MSKDPSPRPDLATAVSASPLDAAGAAPFRAADQRPIVRLVPQSGVQFIDITLPVARLAEIQLSFAEHRYASGGSFRTVLMPLERAGSGDVVWHPVSHRALAPDEIMSVPGQAALDTFAGRWVPLPYFRFLGRDDSGEATFDTGPENWARLFIAPPLAAPAEPGAEPAGEPVYRLVLAFDTRLEAADRTGERLYLAPNSDDAALGASFKLATGAADLARFASRPWVDGWLRQAFTDQRLRAFGGLPASPFELEHIARYLVLAGLVGRYCAMPEIRFLDTLSRRWPVAVTATDLLIDLTAADTAAVLVDRDADGAAMATATPLALRELANPVTVFSGAIPTQIEFAPQPFGDPGLSRRSGRPDAFLWPSLGRIGREAAALALGATATAGVTGQTALPSRSADTAPSEEAWRVGIESAGAAIGPVVSGALLAHLAEDGAPLSDHGDGRTPAVRPRFAPSALMTFFMTELILHAVSAANAASAITDPARFSGVRRLGRIVLTLPAGMPREVRDSRAAHVAQAVELVWRALGWDASRQVGAPQRPEVVVEAGTDLAAQVFELRREMATRYGNDPSAVSRQASVPSDRGGALVAVSPPRGAHLVRVASLVFGTAGARAIVTDFAAAADGMLSPLQAVSEEWDDSRRAAAAVLADTFILPAISAALAEHGLADPGIFLSRVLDATTGRDSTERNFARRLRSKVVQPAAAALLDVAAELPARVASGRRLQSLRGLAIRGGGRFDPYAADFDALAQREGAASFKLGRIDIRFSQRQLDQAIRDAAEPAIRRAVELVARQGCDLVLVSGELAALPSVAEELIAALPLEPGRIVLPGRGRGEDGGAAAVDRATAVTAGLAPARIAGLAGAYLAGRAAPGFEAFGRVVRAIGHDVTAPMPAPSVTALIAAGGESVSRSLAAAVPAALAPIVVDAELAAGGET